MLLWIAISRLTARECCLGLFDAAPGILVAGSLLVRTLSGSPEPVITNFVVVGFPRQSLADTRAPVK